MSRQDRPLTLPPSGNRAPAAVAEEVPVAEREAVMQALAEAQGLAGPLLPILHGVQDRLGWVPPRVQTLIAQALNVSRADVHGVVTFYSYFRQTPPAARVLYLCRAEACQSVGARALAEHAQRVLGTGFHGTSRDGRITLEPVYCLGNCACGPSLLLDGQLHAQVTPQRFDELIAAPAVKVRA